MINGCWLRPTIRFSVQKNWGDVKCFFRVASMKDGKDSVKNFKNLAPIFFIVLKSIVKLKTVIEDDFKG